MVHCTVQKVLQRVEEGGEVGVISLSPLIRGRGRGPNKTTAKNMASSFLYSLRRAPSNHCWLTLTLRKGAWGGLFHHTSLLRIFSQKCFYCVLICHFFFCKNRSRNSEKLLLEQNKWTSNSKTPWTWSLWKMFNTANSYWWKLKF